MYRDYYNEGAMDLITLQDNEEAYNRYKIKPRILVNVQDIDLSSEIFGCKTSLPLGFSPTAMQRLAHPDGELATSRAAANFGIAMCLSSYATEPIETVAAQGKGNPYAMQMCVLQDRKITKQILQRYKELQDKQSIKQNLVQQARSHQWLVLWLDCDREGENIAFEVGLPSRKQPVTCTDLSNFDMYLKTE